MIQLSSSDKIQEPRYLSPTGMADFCRCEARYCFKKLLGLGSIDTHPALTYGTALHSAMPLLQRGDLELAFNKFRDIWNEGGHADDPKRNLVNALKTLTLWKTQKYDRKAVSYTLIAPPDSALDPLERRSDDEFAFGCDLGGALPLVGFCDGLGLRKDSTELWVVEYKTTSELGPRFTSCFKLHSQIIAYAVGASLLFPDSEVSGCFVEAFRTSKTNAENLTIPVFIEPWHKESFISHFNSTTERISACCESNRWTQDFSACTAYPQHACPWYQCDFINLCHSADWRAQTNQFKQEFKLPFKGFENWIGSLKGESE